MRKIVLATLLSAPLMAQVSNPSIISVTVAPSGSCTAGLPNQQVVSTGVQYSCQNVVAGVGTWGAVNGGSGGSGTVNSGATGQIAYYAGNGTAVSGIAASWMLYNASLPSGIIGNYPFLSSSPTTDTSGNGNSLILPGGASNPTFTSQGAVFSQSTANYIQIPAAVWSAGVTYQAAICQQPDVAGTTVASSGNNELFINSSSATGLILNLYGSSGIQNPRDAWAPGISTTNSVYTTGTSVIFGACHVYTWIANSPDRMFVDRTEATYNAQGSSASAIGVGNGYIGISPSTAFPYAPYFYGTVRSLSVWNRALSTAEIQFTAQNTYLNAVAGGLQWTAPGLYSAASQLNCLGDSITKGLGVTNSFCTSALFVPTETGVNITNYGVTGRTMREISSHAPWDAASVVSPQSPHLTATLLGCTNDAATGNITAATCYGYTVNAANSLHAKGYKVILIPMLDMTGQDAYKDTLDTLYNANWPLFADAYMSPTDANLWADGASANSTYFQGDGIHPTQTGQNLLGTYLTNIYNKLYGSTSTTWNTTSASTYTIAAADSYLIVTANSTLTLPSCKGYSGAWTIKVNPGTTVTLKTAAAAETIDGTNYSSSGLALTAGSVNAVTVVPAAPATATCTWTKSL